MSLLLAQDSFLNDLIDRLESWLNDEMIHAIDDDTKAGLIRAGNLQDDPTLAKINLLIKTGDDKWKHELRKGTISGEWDYTIGGGAAAAGWVRRLIIDLELFFDGDIERVISRRKAMVVQSRVHSAVMRFDLSWIETDSFGEKPYFMHVTDVWMTEGGGEGTFIWRGEMRLEIFTDMEPR